MFVLTFAMKLKSDNYKKSLKYFSIFDQRKIMSDLNMSHGTIPDFVSFPLFRFALAIKLRNFEFESHCNTLKRFYKKRICCQIWICLMEKCPDFVSFPLLGFILVIKLSSIDFECHSNTLIFLGKKRYGIKLQCVPWKNVWFSFISIVRVHFIKKTEVFWFWMSLKYLNISW